MDIEKKIKQINSKIQTTTLFAGISVFEFNIFALLYKALKLAKRNSVFDVNVIENSKCIEMSININLITTLIDNVLILNPNYLSSSTKNTSQSAHLKYSDKGLIGI